MSETIGLGWDGKVGLWCTERHPALYIDQDNELIGFRVINGDWDGVLTDNRMLVIHTQETHQQKLLWRGEVPPEIINYNTALIWIQTQVDAMPALKSWTEAQEIDEWAGDFELETETTEPQGK